MKDLCRHCGQRIERLTDYSWYHIGIIISNKCNDYKNNRAQPAEGAAWVDEKI